MDRYERARLIEELKASGAAARADLERWAAEREAYPPFTPWFLPPEPEEDARPPAPEPNAAPFTKEELIDRIADPVAALLAQRHGKIAGLRGKLAPPPQPPR